MIGNKRKILNKIIKTKPGSLAFTCVVGTGLLTLTAVTAAYALYYRIKEI
jgi:hypothetical protein